LKSYAKVSKEDSRKVLLQERNELRVELARLYERVEALRVQQAEEGAPARHIMR